LSGQSIVVLTGAGISAESGLRTFRGADGWWENYRAEDLASPGAFARDPVLVHRFYNMRRRALLDAKVRPNAAHRALAEFECVHRGDFVLITQNVDDLHERAGSRRILHMHGELLKSRCSHCAHVTSALADLNVSDICTACGRDAGLRPHVVWFGEVPFHLDEIFECLAGCELFISIGTSGNVYPAAGFVELAAAAGAHTVEINLEPSSTESAFREKIYGRAGEGVPAYMRAVSAGSS